MSDTVERLRAALDKAEAEAIEARGCMVGGIWEVSRHHRRLAMVVDRGAHIATELPDEIAEHIARWDPSTVLKLIQRDRALLGEYEEAARYYGQHVSAPAGEAHGLWTAVEASAEFWLSQEGE